LLNQYSLTTTEEGYNFITDSGLTYSLYFTSHYLIDSDDKDIEAISFGFYHQPQKISNRKYDGKIKGTILHVIQDFFQKNPDIGLLFICDSGDGYGRHRKITFSKWYKETNVPIEKFDCSDAHTKEGLYTSILVRSDNPLKDYYVNAFYRTIDKYFSNVDQPIVADAFIAQ
jgi:hypothetical protein